MWDALYDQHVDPKSMIDALVSGKKRHSRP
jgi:hypothetical protein